MTRLKLKTDLQKRLFHHVDTIAHPTGRLPGTREHETARTYIIQQLREMGVTPLDGQYEHPYHWEKENFINVAGVLGDPAAAAPIMLVSHYDTCGPQPGADDNGAAISVNLEVARILAERGTDQPVLFLFPDGEEPPYFLSPQMGSTRFYVDQLQHTLRASVVLDLIGHDLDLPEREDSLLIFGIESHGDWVDVLNAAPSPTRLNIYGLQAAYIGDMSDYHILRQHGEPYLFLTCGRWEHYHEITDTPDRLNYARLERTVAYMVNLIAAIEENLGAANWERDTTDYELATLRRLAGPFLDQVGLKLESRSDISVAISRFHRNFDL